MKDLAQIRADNEDLRASVTDRALENRRVKGAFRDSFFGALPVWRKLLLLEYVNKIPTREGR